jgi:hypothetical protein
LLVKEDEDDIEDTALSEILDQILDQVPKYFQATDDTDKSIMTMYV